jgi:hypothetical protein
MYEEAKISLTSKVSTTFHMRGIYTPNISRQMFLNERLSVKDDI